MLLLLLGLTGAFHAIYPLQTDSFGPFIYLGSNNDALNVDSLRLLRIKHILLIGKREVGLKTLDFRKDHARYHFLEVENELETRHYKEGLQWMENTIDKAQSVHSPGAKLPPENLLIVSARGCQRGGSLGTAFLVRRDGLKVSEAAKEVSKRRNCFVSTPKLLADIKMVDASPKPALTSAGEIASHLLADVGRKVHYRALTAPDLGSCEPVHDVYWYYGDIASPEGHSWHFANSSMDCCNICSWEWNCVYWSYGLAGEHKERCYLKDGSESSYMQDRPHFVSGSRSGLAPAKDRRTEERYAELGEL